MPRDLRKRLSYNSNNNNYYSNKLGAYGPLRHRHEGRFSYWEYQKILEDTQVDVAIDVLLKFLLSKNYILTSASDDPEDVEIYEFIQEMLDNMHTPFRKIRKDMYTSIKYGFACLEKMYDINQDGRIIMTGMYGIHMKTLQANPFVTDENGEVIAIHQQSINGSIDIPIQKVLLTRYNAEFDELYGNSILNRVHEYPKLKDDIITWLITFLHKHA